MPKSTSKLKQYFPMIREREDIKQEIYENPKLLEKYREWDEDSRTVLQMSKSRKSDTAFRDSGVRAIPRIYCCGSIRESMVKRKKPSVIRI